MPKDIFSTNLDFYDIDDEELARQLTLIEFEIFVNIKPSELLNQSWNKPKLRHRAPNVTALIERFNRVSVWCATMIVSEIRLKNRVRAVNKFLRITKVRHKHSTALMLLSASTKFEQLQHLNGNCCMLEFSCSWKAKIHQSSPSTSIARSNNNSPRKETNNIDRCLQNLTI